MADIAYQGLWRTKRTRGTIVLSFLCIKKVSPFFARKFRRHCDRRCDRATFVPFKRYSEGTKETLPQSFHLLIFVMLWFLPRIYWSATKALAPSSARIMHERVHLYLDWKHKNNIDCTSRQVAPLLTDHMIKRQAHSSTERCRSISETGQGYLGRDKGKKNSSTKLSYTWETP